MDQADRLRRWVKRKEMGLDLGLSRFMEDKLSSKKRLIVFLGCDEEAAANSNLLANIAVLAAKKGRRITILDAYKGKLDASIPLGIHPRLSMEDVLHDHARTKEVTYKGAADVKFVKIGATLSNLEHLDFKARNNFFNHWLSLEEESDIIFINEDSPKLALTVNEVVVVTSGHAKVITKLYGMIKQLIHNNKGLSLSLIINMCDSEKDAISATKRLISTVKRFQNVDVEELGFVLLVPDVVKALKARAPFVLKYPYCAASHNVYEITGRILAKNNIAGQQWRGPLGL